MDKLSLNPIHTTSSINSDIKHNQKVALKRLSLPQITDNRHPQSTDEMQI